ncbi:LPS-assembly protein LptD [Algicella marina]|uniref:LPS-assembly protein LptD n=1 Tax=Algicella marina TaxID=2683284 RepID=A0A6P1T0V6_9RHOB|nr:LPS assembly protein LptD [Algicella marina]QHQ34919.1 LPS assembly protein LptD [Algicella marina]
MRTILAVMIWLAATLPSWAQGEEVTLLADRVDISGNGDVITASGAVTVRYQGQVLEARRIIYDRGADRLRAEGPIRLLTGDNVIVLADLAELDADMENGLVMGARLILDEQLQIAAESGERIGGRYNGLDRVVASSCVVCAERPTPLWRIRARRVVHDEVAERIYFRDAWFDLAGYPILYLPALRIPAPGVERATGALMPTFSGSDIYGYGVKLPYYVVLGDHADVTLTPFITSERTILLESEYRQNFRSGNIELSGAFSLTDGLEPGEIRGFVANRGHFDLAYGYDLDFELNLVTDDAFLQEFNYSDDDRLTSFLDVTRYRASDYTEFRIAGYQSLRDGEDAGEIPLVLPSFETRKVWDAGPLDGRLGAGLDVMNLVRTDGRDVLRLGGGGDWRGSHTFDTGIQFAAVGDLRFDAYHISDDAGFDEEFVTRTLPTVGVTLRWPWALNTGAATHVIEPIAQLVYSDSFQSGDIPNEDSLLPELDETSLFSLNRFPGQDAQETGSRANIGINYTRYDPNGWEASLTAGQVFREEAGDRFSVGSGLTGLTSDFIIAASVDLPPGLEMNASALFAPDSLTFRQGSFAIAYESVKFDVETGYVFLAADPQDQTMSLLPERQEYRLSTRYRFAPHWEFTGEFRYDLAETRSILRKAGLTYGNECAEIAFSVSRRLATSGNVPTSTNFGLSLNLTGLGSRSNPEWPTRSCAVR